MAEVVNLLTLIRYTKWLSMLVKIYQVFLHHRLRCHSGLQFYDGITTDEIQKILIKSASDLNFFR